MERPKPLTVLAHLGRLLLVLSSLTAGWVLLVWTSAPEKVDAWGELALARYVAGPEGELAAAEKAFEEGRVEKALDLWRELARSLDKTPRGDRLFTVRRSALRRFAEESARRGQVSEALEALETLVQADPRDVKAEMERNELELRAPGLRQVGEANIEELFEGIPTSREVALRFLRLSAERRDLRGALRAAEMIQRTALARASFDDWRFLWATDSGGSFSRERLVSSAPVWTEQGRLELTATLVENEDIQRFRVDTPTDLFIRVEDPEIVFASAVGVNRWRWLELDVTSRGLVDSRSGAPGGGWVTAPSGENQVSYFFFDLPVPLSAQQGLEVRFSAKISPALPAEIRPLLADEALVAEARQELIAVADHARLDLLESMLANMATGGSP